MANLREIKLIKNEFLILKEKYLFSKLIIKNLENEIISTNSNPDINLINIENKVENNLNFENKFNKYFNKSDEDNFFQKKITEKSFLMLEKDSSFKIEGEGIIFIEIKNDLNLELIFEKNSKNSKSFSNIIIKILVKKNKILNLVDFSNSKNLYKHMEVYLEENSQLNNSQFILNSILSKTKVFLGKNSKYNLKSIYSGIQNNNYIINKAQHLEKNSKSNLEINGFAKDNSKIINDTIILIEKEAIKSEGKQKMKNLIFDEKSQIQSEPILEIKNKDVICSHSSSISQISNKILFYINSRGISKKEAINLILESYFNLVIESIKSERLKIKYHKIFENY